jgi:hypothetical protein
MTASGPSAQIRCLGAFAGISMLAMVHFPMSLAPLVAAMLARPLAPSGSRRSF